MYSIVVRKSNFFWSSGASKIPGMHPGSGESGFPQNRGPDSPALGIKPVPLIVETPLRKLNLIPRKEKEAGIRGGPAYR